MGEQLRHDKQNMERLRAEMAILALADPSNMVSQVPIEDRARKVAPSLDLENPGLTRAQLEDLRWKVSAPVAESIFMRLGMHLEGRSARKIYAWPLILKLEGVSDVLAHRAARNTHPHLFEDLIDAKNASLLLGMSQPHLRKLVDAGQLPGCDVIRLGARGMYRFRAAQIEAEARRRISVRLVGGASICAQ